MALENSAAHAAQVEASLFATADSASAPRHYDSAHNYPSLEITRIASDISNLQCSRGGAPAVPLRPGSEVLRHAYRPEHTNRLHCHHFVIDRKLPTRSSQFCNSSSELSAVTKQRNRQSHTGSCCITPAPPKLRRRCKALSSLSNFCRGTQQQHQLGNLMSTTIT
jgi:hypothetical protein|eukprot:COSAG02_NODE_622_length_19435_cov_3.242398_5_plen_165_part_00